MVSPPWPATLAISLWTAGLDYVWGPWRAKAPGALSVSLWIAGLNYAWRAKEMVSLSWSAALAISLWTGRPGLDSVWRPWRAKEMASPESQSGALAVSLWIAGLDSAWRAKEMVLPSCSAALAISLWTAGLDSVWRPWRAKEMASPESRPGALAVSLWIAGLDSA